MVRLSEAMARLHCCDEVLTKHVKEAFRLLNKSIIRVETPEINFEAEEEIPRDLQEEEEEDDGSHENEVPNEIGPVTNGNDEPVSNGVEKPVATTTRKMKVTYEQYRSIANLLIMHLRHMEETDEDGELGTPSSCDWPIAIIW